jgi:hypothetical protein
MSRWDGLSETRGTYSTAHVEIPDDVSSRSGSTPDRDRWEPVQMRPEHTRDAAPESERAGRDWRQEVQGSDRTYHLRSSEWTALRDVGMFRVVAESDLQRDAADPNVLRNDVRHLVEEGLLERKTAIVNQQPTSLLVLTHEGKSLLENTARDPGHGRSQQYHSGLVKPRELAHDVQIYRAYQVERERIEEDGGYVRRVSLDHEIKAEYQAFLNRTDKPPDANFEEDMQAFAASHHLPVIDGHQELPDLRIEYDDADGRIETRDVEVVTEHYSRAQLAGKARAGFSLYRSAPTGIGRTGGSRSGSTPMDPHNLEWLR